MNPDIVMGRFYIKQTKIAHVTSFLINTHRALQTLLALYGFSGTEDREYIWPTMDVRDCGISLWVKVASALVGLKASS